MRLTWLAAASCLASTIGLGCTGPSYDTSPPFDPEPPGVYVAKVKNILVGLPPTDAEVAAVVADPTALPGLIDGWVQLPQYQQKMMVFFELAFQQTQITKTDFVGISPPNGIGNGTDIPLVVQNARESFARTALAMTGSDTPLNQTFTTKTVMMTTALMQVYAYLDTHQNNDAGQVNDVFAKANPSLNITLEYAQGPLTIQQSMDSSNPTTYMHFYNPDIITQQYPVGDEACDGADPITFKANAEQLLNAMYGEIPPHTVGTTNCPIRGGTGKGTQLIASDWNDWRPVTINPTAGGPITPFYDLGSLRSATTLSLDSPRPGFFTTPAFQANWPTNSSNQMRVTLNQALIVSTGAAIDGTDVTTPGANPPGLDAAHATPGSACYGCHQLLDPTRSILTKTYTFFYNSPQLDSMYDNQPGLFAFQGVVQPMTTIDDFANILANHPLVPAAWAQKLCYYANSAPCDPTDPEFQRIVKDFGASYSWNTLVRELLSSPITTNTSATKTYFTNGEVIAVTRRDHLCAALNNRLGFDDICQLDAANQAKLTTISEVVSGMPSDGYGRGATVPVLPNQPTLFYRGGLENICASVSAMVIDAKVNPQQPNAKVWTSSQPAAAIADFVSQIMALTASDPRAAQANALLTAHFAAAQQSGANATDSLRSTFVAACLSPTFIGIGM